MIAVLSASSPLASVAIFRSDGRLLAQAEQEAPLAASGACLRLLERVLGSRTLGEVELFVADTGPGSFTGAKVGVTLAKCLAFSLGKPAAGVSSFDLIASGRIAFVPSRKGEWHVRRPGEEPFRTAELPSGDAVGYGVGIEAPTYPHAARAEGLLEGLERIAPERLAPTYFAEPSISKPNRPYGPAAGAGPA
jgi:tRNA threonylcarbamoyladenosine biosynthesis protein TsaB